MRRSLQTALLLAPAAFILAGSATALAQNKAMPDKSMSHKTISDKALMAKLQKAAPPNVFKGATILNMAPDGSMKVVRKGDNGWTCMDPSGTDPMCADQGGMEWGQAYMSHGAAPQKLGFIYMLRGDNGASNTDPFATGPTKDNNWVKTGAHVMIVGAEAKGMAANYPRSPKADPTMPYVMWAGTPYEHLMLPIR
ncbi:hypothetical protein NK718_03225 [Alsobacter sp. SYSU M60028]|uniref:Uncharacterized protein n=1 Tax=Alsobacter ponti TaxID=2962936 RepID=A0ABT1L7P8_9HYPH|nr:hypothetical protein [Alsobacter ponti]MCP8937516.1 hypothetical protein [Alsobacter ponti]